MVESVRECCQQGVITYPQHPREQWVLQWPGQVVLVVTAIYWTQDVATAIASCQPGQLQVCADRCTSQLSDVVNLVRGELSNLNRCAAMPWQPQAVLHDNQTKLGNHSVVLHWQVQCRVVRSARYGYLEYVIANSFQQL